MPVPSRRLLLRSLLLAASLVPAILQAAERDPAAMAAAVPTAVPADLPGRFRDFLEVAAPLLSTPEREIFLALKQDYQRDAFVRRFWQVRDPFPQTPRNEFAERWQERTKLARERFKDLADDRARFLMLLGAPARVLPSHCPDVLLPLEVWFFSNAAPVRGDFNLVFYSPQGSAGGRFRLWYPSEGLLPLQSLQARSGPAAGPGDVEDAAREITDSCSRGDEILGGLAGAIDWERVEKSPAATAILPRPGEEWLQTFASYSTDLPAGAAPFPAELALSFPGRHQSRTVVQGLLSIPREEAKLTELQGYASYNFLVDGEVVHQDELFEHFRYRFTLPEKEAREGKIPLVFQRLLRPGSYTLIVKVEDVASQRFYRDERPLEVPATADSPPPPADTTAAAAPGQAAATAAASGSTAGIDPAGRGSNLLAEANAVLQKGDHGIRILPPPDQLLTGRARVEAIATGEGIARVSFLLDGKAVLSKITPPYSVELNLGDQPRVHSVVALASGPGGEELAKDEVLLNAGPHRFAVRLLEPQPGKTYKASVRAQAEVTVPEGDTLDRVEFYLDETLLATLYQPPFVQPIVIPEGEQLTYVRTVAYLEGGNSSEDVVVVNSPESERVDVDLVELFTTVVDRRGRPVEGLEKGDFKVFEDGTEQQVRRFELVKNLPIYAGILLDTSASMTEELPEAVHGALDFFSTIITPKDRAAVITFNDKPTLAVRFTSNREVLAGGLANVVAEGNTTLYDSLIYAFYYFGGIRGRRAIILLSDGRDEGSRYQFGDTLEYARRTGVTIYAVGINLGHQEAEARLKLQRLAEETGGKSFFVESAGELKGVYQSIQDELRTQYLVAYESSQAGQKSDPKSGKFRAVEVKLGRPGLTAKTVHGYYP